MTIYYVGLEPYESRYTLQLTEWNVQKFEQRKVDYMIVNGKTIDNSKQIFSGNVLDAHGRTFYSMSQMMTIIQMLRDQQINSNDVIFFEDMFTPGIESLFYIMSQMSERPKIYVRCLAQTPDPDDFVHYTGMTPWMRKYEEMVDQFVDGIICASEEMVAHLNIAGWKSPKYVTGLPFGKQEVLSRVKEIKPFNERRIRVMFASRFDTEKQPQFFCDVANYLYNETSASFAFLTGNNQVKSNNSDIENMIINMCHSDPDRFELHTGLSKNQYYEILNNSKVLFNCALQDWVSNTVSEADAMGCNLVFPAYRSFPEVFNFDETRLYVPWSIKDAADKILNALKQPHPRQGQISSYQDRSIDRTIDILTNNFNANQYLRSDDYRKHVSLKKWK